MTTSALGLTSTAHVRALRTARCLSPPAARGADPDRHQTMLVRYNTQEEATAGAPAWNLASSYQCVQQLLATDPTQLSPGFSEAVAQGVAPTQLSMRIVEAPAELCGPVRTERCVWLGYCCAGV